MGHAPISDIIRDATIGLKQLVQRGPRETKRRTEQFHAKIGPMKVLRDELTKLDLSRRKIVAAIFIVRSQDRVADRKRRLGQMISLLGVGARQACPHIQQMIGQQLQQRIAA